MYLISSIEHKITQIYDIVLNAIKRYLCFIKEKSLKSQCSKL